MVLVSVSHGFGIFSCLMMYSVLILYIFQNLFRCKFVVLSIFREDFKSLVWIEANTTYQK